MASVANGKNSRGDPWRRFAWVFAALAIASEAAYFAVLRGSAPFDAYLGGLAWLGGLVLNTFGQSVGVEAATIHGPRFVVEVSDGCDAVQICSLLVAAMIAVPVPMRPKIRGVLGGLGFLQALNLTRIVTLYAIGAHWPDVFMLFHATLWPVVLLAMTVACWAVWMIWDVGLDAVARIDDV
jgi:exosortase/archaeosortase family protein